MDISLFDVIMFDHSWLEESGFFIWKMIVFFLLGSWSALVNRSDSTKINSYWETLFWFLIILMYSNNRHHNSFISLTYLWFVLSSGGSYICTFKSPHFTTFTDHTLICGHSRWVLIKVVDIKVKVRKRIKKSKILL